MRIAYSNVLSQSWESALATLAMLQLGGAEANLKLAANICHRRAAAPVISAIAMQRHSPAEDMLQRHHGILFQESILAAAETQSGETCWNGAVVVVGLSSTWEPVALRQSAGLFSWIQGKQAWVVTHKEGRHTSAHHFGSN